MEGDITYRLATDADTDRINDFYNGIYKKSRTREQFNWEYHSAPAGRAIYVIAEQDGKVVGTQCAIPYYVITKSNREILTAKSEDTLVSHAHRGKQIFEHMYRLLFEECRQKHISFIWGFTYAAKPFKKIGFDIPFSSAMGLLTMKPVKAARYFYSVTAVKNALSYTKILGLSFASYARYLALRLKRTPQLETDESMPELNGEHINYLEYDKAFGLKLDKAFLDYRITHNPYSKNYRTVNFRSGGILKASVQYNITQQQVGFIIHMYFHNSMSEQERLEFLRLAILRTALRQCIVVRFWGFTHNSQNREEIALLKKSSFIFIKRGISFVGRHLDASPSVSFGDFVLSRMASQGTD